MKSKSDINSLVKKLSNLNKSYDSLLVDAIPFENIINKKIPVIYANNEIIKKNTKSIELENILKKFPPQAIGSVSLYNQFNHKANEFDT